MRDSLQRGEAPIASHLLYTQVLDDTVVKERKQGIEAGFSWNQYAVKTVFYTDLGWSLGMKWGADNARDNNRHTEYRKLVHWKWIPVWSELKTLVTLIKEVFVEYVVKSKFR